MNILTISEMDNLEVNGEKHNVIKTKLMYMYGSHKAKGNFFEHQNRDSV